MEDSSALKRLVEEAYRFGYFVGYRGHSEWTGWVRKKKLQLYSTAEELGVLELVQEAYNRGRTEGMKKREEDIRKGLGKEPSSREGSEARGIVTFGETEGGAPDEDTERKVEVEFAMFLEATRLYLPPDLLNTLKNLRPPKMLRPRF